MLKRAALIILALVGLFVIAACSPKDAKGLFKAECTKCHSYKGIGSGIIDLDYITENRSDTWIRDQIEDARRHDPNSGMPRFGGALTSEEIDALIQFLHSDPK